MRACAFSGVLCLSNTAFLFICISQSCQAFENINLDVVPNPSGVQPASEIPFIPSPRTAHSSNGDQIRNWFRYQTRLKDKIATVNKVNVLFYGDSITESLEGLSYGNNCRRCVGIYEVAKYCIVLYVDLTIYLFR